MVTVVIALAMVVSVGSGALQYSRYGFVSPASGLYRLVTLLPAGIADRVPSPGFGTLERLIVGEIVRSRTTSPAGTVSIPHRFEIALSSDDWATVKESPGFFLSDTALAVEELALKRGWVIEEHLALEWTKRANVPTGQPKLTVIGPAVSPVRDAPPRTITTNGPLARAEAKARSRRASRVALHERETGGGWPVPDARSIGTLVLEPLEPDAPAIHMMPHMHKLLIGRDRNADVVIDRDSVSRRQCGIERVDGGFVVADLGSTNGTRINGAAVGEGTAIAVGDVLELAQTVSYRRV